MALGFVINDITGDSLTVSNDVDLVSVEMVAKDGRKHYFYITIEKWQNLKSFIDKGIVTSLREETNEERAKRLSRKIVNFKIGK